MTRHLDETIDALAYPGVRAALGVGEETYTALAQIPAEVRTRARSLLRKAGRPARALPEATATILSWIVVPMGAIIGALVGKALIEDLKTFCGAAGNIIDAFLLPLPVRILVGGVILSKIIQFIRERKESTLVSYWMRTEAAKHLIMVAQQADPDYIAALKRELGLILQLKREDPAASAAVLEIHDIPVNYGDHSVSRYRRLKLSGYNQLSSIQLQMVLGIYLGLVVPALLGTSC